MAGMAVALPTVPAPTPDVGRSPATIFLKSGAPDPPLEGPANMLF